MRSTNSQSIGAQKAPLGIPDTSPPPSESAGEVTQGGCNGGNGAAYPPCPTADGRETVRVVGVSAASAAANDGGIPLISKLRSDSKQVRLVLPGLIVRDMGKLAPTRMGDLLKLALITRIRDPRDLPQLVSSAEQVGRLGVLLAQTIPSRRKSGIGPLVMEIKSLLPRIKQLSLPRTKPHNQSSAEDSPESNQLRRRTRWVDAAFSLRLRLPSEFADVILEMPADLRSRALWLALDPGVAESFDLQKLIAGEERVKQAGKNLNQALRLAGKERDLTELAPAVENVLVVLGTLRNLKLKGGEE